MGKEWELEKVMRWREVRNAQGEASGLYKVRGAAVEGIVGAVYMQFVSLPFSLLFISFCLVFSFLLTFLSALFVTIQNRVFKHHQIYLST